MGIVCSGPSKNFINPAMNGENGAFTEDIVVRVSDEGFCPSELVLHKGQCILFEWNVEKPSPGVNIIQVSGAELNCVPGGYNSGSLSYSGSFRVCLGREGLFNFVSGSFSDKLKTLKVQVLEKPVSKIKINDGRFEQQFVSIQEGDTVQWSCENGVAETPCYVQEMEYCLKHGGFIFKSRLEVKSVCEKTFHNTGLHYFHLGNFDADWNDDDMNISSFCLVKVTQTDRQFLVHPSEEGLQPNLISARVQDRIWLDCSFSRIHGSKIVDAFIYKDSLASPLVTAKLSGSSRIAELVSHQFTEQGLYHYVYNMADLSQLRGCVVVQPKPREHVIKITDGQFTTALGTVFQGERVWWTQRQHEQSFILKELSCCTPAKGFQAVRQKSFRSGCGCKKVMDQESIMSQLGVATHKFDEIGEFTYCLMLQGDTDRVPQSHCCSVVVERTAKHHTIKVHDQGFWPRILNVHPGDWVWWQWESTKRCHNIVQVSHQHIPIPGGFYSGKPTCSASAFTNVFTEFGVFYFASNGLPEVFGAVVVTPESQVHKVHLAVQGIQPDPLVIAANDCVSWVWLDGESFSVQQILQPEHDVGKTSAHSSNDAYKRCYSQVLSKPGMYNFLCTASHKADKNEVHSQETESFIYSVLVDPVSYSCMVGVTADGFKPSTVTVAQSQSVLWSWADQGDEEHNILHVRPPQDQQQLTRVRGLSAFDSGPKTTRSTFFHTFDVPGRYFITSQGTDAQLCLVDVIENAAYVSSPKISAAEGNGGNVECGYRVFLECATVDAEIFYTTDGSCPADCNAELLHYKEKTGIVLTKAGFTVVRAIAKKNGWVTSPVYTSKRFWVVEGEKFGQEESADEQDEQCLETGSAEVDLREEIFKWHWLSCRPNIMMELVCDNTFNIDVALGNAADLTWIKGFQLFMNGTPYGGWFSPHCRSLVVSGLIGGKVYHVVLVVFASHDSFEPQLSNEVVISCPLQASSGGPLVSLEAATSPQSLVIVWPAYGFPAEVTGYSVFINGQPFGEQIIPEADSEYCRVLFESRLQHEVYTLCVASHLSESDVRLYSNEVEFTLPVPEEILSALHKPKDDEDSIGGHDLEDGDVPARELLLIAERVIPQSSVTEQSGIEKLALKSVTSRLQTIPEDQQLDVMAAEANAENMENVPFTENGATEAEPREQQSGVQEQRDTTVIDERIPVVKNEADLHDTPHNASLLQDAANSELIFELDATVFKDRGESVSAKDANLGPLEEGTEAEEIESQVLGRDTGEEDLGEQHSEVDKEILDNERNNIDSSDQQGNEGNGSSKEVPDKNGVTYQATNGDDKTEVESKLDNEAETFGTERISEQSDSDFWDHAEKQQHEQEITKAASVSLAAHGDDNSHATRHASSHNDVEYHESKHAADFQEHLDIKTHDTDTGKDHEQEHGYFEGLEQGADTGNNHESQVRDYDVGLDTNVDEPITELISKRNAKENDFPDKDNGNSDVEEASNSGNNAVGDDESAVDTAIGETWQKERDGNAKLSVGPTDAGESNEGREYKEECYDKGEDSELKVEEVNQLYKEVERGLDGVQPLEKILTKLQQEPPSNNSMVEKQDILLPEEEEEDEERNGKRFRENSTIYETMPYKNVNSGESKTMAKHSEHVMSDQVHSMDDVTDEREPTAEGEKQTCYEVSKDTWSASSILGSVKNEDDDNKDEMATTDMPTFEEAAFKGDVLLSHSNIEGSGGLQQVDKEHKISSSKRNVERPLRGDSLQGLGTSPTDLSQAGSEQLPRPLLVIKGTTPTTVTLEWEWSLLPEQIAGADVLYSVLILGSKFHSNITSTLCFSFEDSPAKTMWPKQNSSLKQHSWRTTNTVIEITGLKPRCNYRLAVLGQLMPCVNDCLSSVISFTMPGPPKPPLIHVTDLKDREVTLTWKPPASFGEATIVGYRLLNNGKAFQDDLDCETLSLSLNGLEEGKHYSFSLLALTGHSVGDSKPSNTVIVHCPTPPTSPQIYPRESTTAGSISIAWKHEEPASTDNAARHAHYSYNIFVDDLLYGECLLGGLTDIFEDEYAYTVPNCEFGRKYRVCVKSYLNPREIGSGVDNTMYVCGCYGTSSNVLDLYCAGPPSPPNVRISWIDQSGVTLSWSRSREFGGVTLAGYILQVNGKWSEELFPPEQHETKLTGFSPGDVIRVQLAAVTGDLVGPISDVVNQEGNKSRCFPPSYEPPDSGVESSSSFLSKRSTYSATQFSRSVGPPLVIQFSNFVKKVSSLEVINVGCWSALITWSLDDTADRCVEPEVLNLSCWKATEQKESAVRHVVRERPFRIRDLEPGIEYCVILECFASHVNDDKSSERPINRTQSQSTSFKTGLAPGPPRNIYVASATDQSIKLAWEPPEEHGVPAMMIQLNSRKKDENVTDKGTDVKVSPGTCVFNFDCLASRTEYTFTLKVLTEEELLEISEVMAGSIASFSAWTNGVEPADKLNLESRTPTSLVIKWQPAVAYGMSTVQHYVVHYVQNKQLRKRSRGRVGPVKEAGKELIVEPERCYTELCGLEPGTVYRIIVQTVDGLTDHSYDEDFESEGSDTNSIISSASSDKPPEVQQMHLSGSLLICTAAPPEPPVLLVRGFTATQIELSWNRPLVLKPVVVSRSAVGEDPARGRVRHLKGFRVEVNGRVYARLAANKTNITLKKCKSGMKYTCVVVVMTCPEKSDGHQRKSETLDAAVNDTDTDEDSNPLSGCFEESASDPVEVTLPRQDWGVSLSANYCENKPAGSLQDSPCSESGEEEEGGVEVRWKMTELADDVSGYRLVWYNSKEQDRNEVIFPGDAIEYEIWSVSVSALYTFYLEILDIREEAVTVFGPVHCQTPGPPSSPWIWCRTLSSYQITIEWNEPATYGNVTIRGYQVYLNERRLEKIVDCRQRRVNIHCQSSSVYRIYVVALGSDPQHGDSPPSNVLTLCTPVVQDSIMARRPSGGITRPPFDVTVNVLSTSNTSISIEWTHPAEIVDTADHYLIKWSSVLRPQVQESTLPLIQTCHVIHDCLPGTSHFVVVAAVNAARGLVARSQQFTVQTSAPVTQPALQLRACLQSGITIEWRKPTTFGDAEIDYYQLMVNGEPGTDLDVECDHYKLTDCQPCEQYTFILKAFSTKAACDSDWSEPLVVTCPGAEKPLITRIPSQQGNCIKIGWKTPLLKGGAKVDSCKVYYQEDKGNMVTSQDIISDAQSIQHGPLPSNIEEDKLMDVPTDSYYWVVLQVQLTPVGCKSVYSEPIRTRVAVSPDPPMISLEVEGLDQRRRLEERIYELSNKRDRLHRILHLLENSVVVKGSKQKDLQIAKATDTMLELDSELADALEDIKEYTGSISTLIRWSRPRDDGDAVVSGYEVFADGIRCGKILSQWTLETRVKLPVANHVIAVQTLTDHPVGSSPLSNAIELSGHEFLPFVLFCYFDVHKRSESWPNSGCCRWADSHSYELKHRMRASGRVFIPRGILLHRIPCPVFSVMDVFSAQCRPLAPAGINKMVALLFWTKWCFSSQKVMEHFLQFSEEFVDKFAFITCCVRSEEPVTSHRQSLANILTERNWRKTNDSVMHTCGCYSQSQRTRSIRRGLINDPDVCQLFGLVGAPTLILLDSSGYISWQGRCCCQDASSFRTFLLHASSQVSGCPCPVSSCTDCDLDKEDDQDPSTSEIDESVEKLSSQHRRESVELSSLHLRLHGAKPDGRDFALRRSFAPQSLKKELTRPKTTTGASRYTKSPGFNRSSGFNEPFRSYSRSFSAYGATQPRRPGTARPGSVSVRSHSRAPQISTEFSSGDFSLPVVTRQRGKRTHPLERGAARRIKTKISIEDFNLLHK